MEGLITVEWHCIIQTANTKQPHYAHYHLLSLFNCVYQFLIKKLHVPMN